MPKTNLFDFNYNLDLPVQDKFPLNLSVQGRRGRDILLSDIRNAEKYLILTGFTSFSNLIDVLGTVDYPK